MSGQTGVDLYRCVLVKEKAAEYKTRITKPEDVEPVFRAMGFGNFTEEVVGILCIDSKGNCIGYHEVSRGDINTSIVHPREVYKRALLNNAYGIIMAHNHLSGDVTPSMEDLDVTARLKEAGQVIGVKFCDHIIIGEAEVFSFREDTTLLD